MNAFSNYDAWLTTDRLADQQEAYAEMLSEAWGTYVDTIGEYYVIPYEAIETDHPAHAIYVAWEALFHAVESYNDRILAAEEWEAQAASDACEREQEREQQIEAIRAEEQMALDSQYEATHFDGFYPADDFNEERGLKILHCVVCGVPMKVIPSADRAWCKDHGVDIDGGIGVVFTQSEER